jgi:hypothetical protein
MIHKPTNLSLDSSIETRSVILLSERTDAHLISSHGFRAEGFVLKDECMHFLPKEHSYLLEETSCVSCEVRTNL